MEEAVHGKVCHFPVAAVAVFLSLANGAVKIDDDVAQFRFFFRHIVFAFIQCEGKDVRRRIYLPVIAVQLMDRV